MFLVAAVVAAGGGAHAQVGINAHVPSDAMLDLVQESGATWIRVDANWDLLQPRAGGFAFEVLDSRVAAARARGLSIYATLAYTPGWVPRVDRPRDDGYLGNDEPAGSGEWVAFVEAAVRHYRGMGITHFGIWNEPNLEHFWEGDLDAYIDKILAPGAAAVRRVCGDCRVLGPDLAHTGPVDEALAHILARAAGSFDILAHHLYNDWPENGHTAIDGDSFLQALEMRRAAFLRESMREVLDRYGWTGEVWITETGYRADPGDAGEEAKQATYVRRVLEEQARRDWWTHTFFYEIMDCGIDQPECDIDGFGLTRPTRMLPRTASDFRRKPAFDALRSHLSANPGILDEAPLACANGRDDDGDGRVDGDDRGCRGEGDGDEADRARPVLSARRTEAPRVDGNLTDWADEHWVTLSEFAGPGEREELHVRAAARWSEGALHLAFEVQDDEHVNEQPESMLWASDSVQVAFDPGGEFGAEGYDANDHEFSIAYAGREQTVFRHHGEGAAPEIAVLRLGDLTAYEATFDAAAIGELGGEGSRIGFSFVVNDDDGAGREGWMRWTRGIAETKSPYFFGELVLADAAPPEDAGPGGEDAGTAGDAGSAGDAGGTGPGGDDGCACRSSSGSSAVWLLLAVVALRRRR